VLHRRIFQLFKKSRTALTNASGCSYITMCPASLIVALREFLIRLANSPAYTGGISRSDSPHKTRVSAAIRHARFFNPRSGIGHRKRLAWVNRLVRSTYISASCLGSVGMVVNIWANGDLGS